MYSGGGVCENNHYPPPFTMMKWNGQDPGQS